ncbi:hypothetical protein [Conexibacter sp. SYSU D00693]|uniref:hypothetical protein n=1 Tax=Conexibacter sp. SYSU D00693 TaxID=2812560 RepID=UPI00196AF23A|nr:hypothetical protein [Conexibacter sp. SYSU D00693]
MVVRRLCVLLALLGALALPATAAAQSNPFQPLPAPQQPAPEPLPVDDEDDGLGVTETLLIVLAAGCLIGGIAWFVVRDARGAAPVDSDHDRREDAAGHRSPEHQRKAKQRARAAGKRARQARKTTKRKAKGR